MTTTLRAPVLVCEDEPRLRALIRHALGGGYALAIARNGDEGLLLAREILPAAIITDIAMPVMDGFTFALELSADPVLRHVPLAFATGSLHRSAVQRFRPSRSLHVLMKPYTVGQLRHMVEQLVGSHPASEVK